MNLAFFSLNHFNNYLLVHFVSICMWWNTRLDLERTIPNMSLAWLLTLHVMWLRSHYLLHWSNRKSTSLVMHANANLLKVTSRKLFYMWKKTILDGLCFMFGCVWIELRAASILLVSWCPLVKSRDHAGKFKILLAI